MTDIERRLRDLGERVRDEQGPGTLPPAVIRSARRRRLATVATGLVVVSALMFGVTFAAGTFDPEPRLLPPADTTETEGGTRLQAAYPGRGRASAILYPGEGMVCFGMADLRAGHGSYTSAQILLGQDATRPIVSTPPPGDQADRPCVGGLDRSVLESIVSDPGRYFLEIKVPTAEFAGEETLIASLAIPAGDDCTRIDFEPTYLPEGCKEKGEDPPSRQNFGAIWPEDTEERAGEECTSIQHVDDHWRSDPIRTAERFATDVLGWKEAQARQSKSDEGGVGVYVGNGPISSESPVVATYVKEVFGGCWSVISVSRLPDGDPTGVSVSVRGHRVQVGFDTLDAVGGTVEIGYGGRVETQSWGAAEAKAGPVTFELNFDTDTTGHFLILFEDKEGNVFSAAGGPLPAGDFSAG